MYACVKVFIVILILVLFVLLYIYIFDIYLQSVLFYIFTNIYNYICLNI